MANRIDHAAEAHRHIEWAHEQQSEDGRFDETVQHNATLAVAEATLALVEQQRISNLIALSQAQDGNGWQAAEPLEGLFGYVQPDPEDGFGGLHVRSEIKEALGLS